MAIKSRRIYEVAKDFRVSSQALVKVLRELGFTPKSHMSLATPEMIFAINKRFAEEKRSARAEMEQKKVAKEKTDARGHSVTPAESRGTVAGVSGIRVIGGGAMVDGVMRRLEKKKKKKDRRRKKDRREVDQQEVNKAFRSTMANLDGTKGKKKYRRATGDDSDPDETNSKAILVSEYMSVAQLANLMDMKAVQVISKLLELGMMATINQRLDMDSIEMVAAEFGFEVKIAQEIGDAARELEHTDLMVTRAPVVTVMGHVDHGKTSLLDYIRKTNVVGREAGAITQHVGAYQVRHGDSRIVFLDTPGHEAFTAMRARGSQLTDIVVIVIAADEGIKPQTLEAVDHSRAAGAPIIVAISKIDKPNANPEAIRTQLANHNLLVEAWGGKVIAVEISSKSGEGIDKLLEMILLQAEMLDLKADPSIRGQGVVVEARLEKGRGPVATVLIQTGSCKTGDPIVAGVTSGHLRTITNDRDEILAQVGPSTPVQITGLSSVPKAGDSFMVVTSDQEAKEITVSRSQIKRESEFRRAQGPVSLEKLYDQIQEGQIKDVRLVIKGDVDGSIGVLADTLGKISTDEVKTNIIRSGVGAISESDVVLAAASNAIIIGFHVTADARAREMARQENVDIRFYDIIYEAENDIKKALEGLLAPDVTEHMVGMAEVREIFKVPKAGTVAGCYVKEGRISRKDKLRVTRDGKVIYTGAVSSLRRFKEDAREVKENFECGIGVENFNDIKVGDNIEAFELVEVARTLG